MGELLMNFIDMLEEDTTTGNPEKSNWNFRYK